MRYLFVFIMITVCGRSKAESRELSTSVLRILILLLSLSHVLYNPVPQSSYQELVTKSCSVPVSQSGLNP